MTRTQVTTPRSRSAVRTWPHWLALVLVLLAVFLLARWVFHARVPNGSLTNHATAESQTPASVSFDFYTVLPKMAVSSPPPPPPPGSPLPKVAKLPSVTPPTTSVMSSAPTSAQTQSQKQLRAEVYVLQLAAVRNLAEAERLSDDLRSQGAPAFIQSYRAGEILWYRVMMGPYASQDLARRQQDRLKDRRINAILLKRPPI